MKKTAGMLACAALLGIGIAAYVVLDHLSGIPGEQDSSSSQGAERLGLSEESRQTDSVADLDNALKETAGDALGLQQTAPAPPRDAQTSAMGVVGEATIQLREAFRLGVEDQGFQLESARPSSGSASPSLKAISAMDEVFQRVLRAYLKAGFSLSEAREQTEDLVGWVEVPVVTAAGGRDDERQLTAGYEMGQLQGEYDTKPLVLYQDVRSRDAGQVSLCQGAYVVAHSTHRFRVRTTPYAVVVDEMKVETNYLGGEELGPWYPGNSAMVVDWFDVGESLPLVGILSGPAGSADYVSFTVNRFDPEKKEWRTFGGNEYTGVSAWEYNAEERILTLWSYTTPYGSERTSGTVDVDDLVGEQAQQRAGLTLLPR